MKPGVYEVVMAVLYKNGEHAGRLEEEFAEFGLRILQRLCARLPEQNFIYSPKMDWFKGGVRWDDKKKLRLLRLHISLRLEGVSGIVPVAADFTASSSKAFLRKDPSAIADQMALQMLKQARAIFQGEGKRVNAIEKILAEAAEQIVQGGR